VTTRRFAPLLTAFAVLLAVVAPAAAQEALDVRLVDSTLEADGTTTLVLTVDGPSIGDEGVPADAFAVTENGETIEGLRVAPVVEEEEPPPSTVVILFDISGSAAGEPIAAARDAAIGLVETVVPQGVEVGLVPFGNAAEVAVEPTDQVDVLRAAIADLEAGGNTALYDAVVLGAELFADREGERSIVLFTDGGDNTSEASDRGSRRRLSRGWRATHQRRADHPGPGPRGPRPARGRHRRPTPRGRGRRGARGAFEQVARSLTSQYVLRYDSDILGEELDLTVTVDHEGQFGELQAVLLNPRVEFEVEEALPEPTPVAPREVGLLGDPVVLAIALATAFLALLLLFGLLFVPRADRAASRTLRRGVTMISRGDSGRASADSGLAASAIGRAAVDLVSKAPRPRATTSVCRPTSTGPGGSCARASSRRSGSSRRSAGSCCSGP
jgi:hypothetical protein